MARANYVLDWVGSIQASIGNEVDRSFPAEAHRWPLLKSFDAVGFEWSPGWFLLVLRNRSTGSTPTIKNGSVLEPCPVPDPLEPSRASIDGEIARVRHLLDLSAVDAAVLLPLPGDTSGSLDDDWDRMTTEQQDLFRLQLDGLLGHQYSALKGFDVDAGFFLPPGYEGLAVSCERFFGDHPRYSSNVLLMTRFGGDRYLDALDEVLRRTLRERGFNPLRADDKTYTPDRSLWGNVCTYMLGCSTGIAILEDRGADEFNPNVALEYGFMRALNKPTLLLVDRGFTNLRADVIGTLREEFDLFDLEETIPPAIARWVRDLS
jgi:hypothetical protein